MNGELEKCYDVESPDMTMHRTEIYGSKRKCRQ